MSQTFTDIRSTTFVVVDCATCAVPFGLTSSLHAARRQDRGDFSCPNGHNNVYRKSEADGLREQLENEQRKVIWARAEAEHQTRERQAAERSASAFKGQATRLRKRIGNGVCPCCNRHFSNVERHMTNKHPDFAVEEPS